MQAEVSVDTIAWFADVATPRHPWRSDTGSFQRRIEGYARLAARAMDLFAHLSTKFDLTLPEKPDYNKQAEGRARNLRV